MTGRRGLRARTTVSTVALVLAVVASSLSGCADGDPAAARRASAIEVLLHGSDVGPLPVASDELVAQLASAPGLRLGLRHLLVQHTLLVGEVLERTEEAGPDLAEASAALAANTDVLVSAIGVVYGPAGARAFHELWAQHAQFLVEYAIAAEEGDGTAQAVAQDALGQYHDDFAAFCNLATGLPTDAVHQLVGGHLDDLLARADAFADGDADAGLDATLRGLAEVVTIADALSGAITGQEPEIFVGTADDPVTELTATILTELVASETAAVAIARADGERDVERSELPFDGEAIPDPELSRLLGDLDTGLADLARGDGDGETLVDRTLAALERWADERGLDESEARAVALVAGAHLQAATRRVAQAADPGATYDVPATAAVPLAAALAAAAVGPSSA